MFIFIQLNKHTHIRPDIKNIIFYLIAKQETEIISTCMLYSVPENKKEMRIVLALFTTQCLEKKKKQQINILQIFC